MASVTLTVKNNWLEKLKASNPHLLESLGLNPSFPEHSIRVGGNSQVTVGSVTFDSDGDGALQIFPSDLIEWVTFFSVDTHELDRSGAWEEDGICIEILKQRDNIRCITVYGPVLEKVREKYQKAVRGEFTAVQ